MKSKAITLCLSAALMVSSVGAFAQAGPGRDDHGGPGGPGEQHGGPGGPGRGGPGGDMHAPDHHGGPHGGPPVPHQDWRAGQRLPDNYRGGNYVVNDWRGHGLRQPPRGYEWHQVNGDYVLAGIATGVITSILLQHH